MKNHYAPRGLKTPMLLTLLAAVFLPGSSYGENCSQDAETKYCEDRCTGETKSYPKDTPCPKGWDDTAGSQIDFRTLVHLHESIEYQTQAPDVAGSSCGPCSGGSSAPTDSNTLQGLEIRRYHRQRTLAAGDAGSLGQSAFLLIDTMVLLGHDDGSSTQCRARLFDPASTLIRKQFVESGAGDTAVNGILHDFPNEYRGVYLLDQNNNPIADWTQAVTVRVIKHDGSMRIFEVMNMNSSSSTSTVRVSRLTKIIDPNGNAWTIDYVYPVNSSQATLGYDSARLWEAQKITDHFGRFATFTYDNTTKRGMKFPVTRIDFPNGTHISYNYTDNELTKVTYPDTSISTIAYSWDNALQWTRIDWDDNGAAKGGTHIRKSTWVSGSSFTDPLTNTVIAQAPGQLRMVRDWDGVPGSMGALRFKMWWEPGVATIRYAFVASKGLLKLKTSEFGGTIQAVQKAITFDLNANPSTYTWETATTYSNTNYSANLPKTYVDKMGFTFLYNYDYNLRRVTKVTYPNKGVFTATPNAFGKIASSTDEMGRKSTYTYDTNGNLLTKTLGSATATGPDGVVRDERSTWRWSYNARGQIATTTDPNNNVTDYTYDSLGQLTKVTSPADVVGGPRAETTITFDGYGRITQKSTTSDAGFKTTNYFYDNRNRVTKITYGDGSAEKFTYGTSGTEANQIIRKTDRNCNVTTIAYDSSGRPAVHTYAAGTPEQMLEVCTYLPGTTLKTSCTKDGELTEYAFDDRRRQISVTTHPNIATALTIRYSYDNKNRKTSEIDPYGRETRFSYDYRDQITQVTQGLIPNGIPSGTLTRLTTSNPAYTITSYGYDLSEKRTSMTDGKGYVTTWRYDSQGRKMEQIEAAKNAAGTALAVAAKTWYFYDAAGNVTKAILPRSFDTTDPAKDAINQFATVFSYNGRNQKASETQAFGRNTPVTGVQATRSWTYTLTGKLKTEVNFRGFTTTYAYSGCCDRLIKVTDHLGFFTSYSYDSNGNILTTTDPNSNVSVSTFDARNRRTTMTNGAGEITRFTYDDNPTSGSGIFSLNDPRLAGLALGAGADGSAVQVINPELESTIAILDGLGRTVRSIDGNGDTTTVTYDAMNSGLLATTTTNPSNDSSSQFTDGAGHVRLFSDAEMQISQFFYDNNGNQVRTVDANGVGTSITFDERNRPITVSDTATGSLYSETKTFYDKHSNVIRQIDAMKKTTSQNFDARDRKISSTDQIGARTQFAYDKNNNLLTIIDGDAGERPESDRTTTYTYDERDLLTQEVYPPGQQTPGVTNKRQYSYDAGRRLKTRTDQAGIDTVTEYFYDNANRLITRQYPDALNDAFGYDHAGRLLTANASRYATLVTRTYDDGGRLLSEDQAINGVTHTVSHSYDVPNRRETITYPDGKMVQRVMTPRGQLKQVFYDSDSVAIRNYDAGGRLKNTSYRNGIVENREYQTGDNLPLSIRATGVTDFQYAFDADKRKLSEADNLDTSRTQNFGYDDANRLTTWNRNKADIDATKREQQTWSLSLVGDWKATTRTIAGVASTETRTSTGVHEAVTLTKNGVTNNLFYDTKGNLTKDQDGRALTWDVENRLASATIRDADTNTNGVAIYRYDALGRRVQKTVFGRSTTFVLDGAHVVYESEALQTIPGSANDNGTGAGTPVGGAIIPDADVLVRVNFQPATTPIPGGFVADKGHVYGVRSNSKTYGWQTAANTRGLAVRGEMPAPQFDTLNQPSGTWTWKMSLPNGSYPVALVMGDPTSLNQTNHVKINGVAFTDPDPAISSPPSSTGQRGDFDVYVTQVTITNGALTITAGTSSVTPKLNFIEIGKKDTLVTQAMRDRASQMIDDATRQTAQSFPVRSPSPRVFVYGSYVDEPLMYVSGNGTDAKKYYVHSNHLYSVAALTDLMGVVVERYKYDAYGQRIVLSPDGVITRAASSYGNQIGFTGRYLDKETGLWYFRARYYSGILGRFVARDSFNHGSSGGGYHDGYNLYAGWFIPNYLDQTGMYRDDNNDGVYDGCKSSSSADDCNCKFDDGANLAEDMLLSATGGKAVSLFRCNIAKTNCTADCLEKEQDCWEPCLACCEAEYVKCAFLAAGGKKKPERKTSKEQLEFEGKTIQKDVDYEHGTGNAGGNRP